MCFLPFPYPLPQTLFINLLTETENLLCICVCNSLLTLWSFSKPMLTCVCYGLKMSSDTLLVNDKLRKKNKTLKPIKTLQHLPPYSHSFSQQRQMHKCFISSIFRLVFILRQSSVTPFYKTNARRSFQVGERMPASGSH